MTEIDQMAENRVLLKISGEMLCETGGFGIDPAHVQDLAQQIQSGLNQGDVQLAMVCGGGNFLRGSQIAGDEIGRITGDNMGMLATIMNALAIQSALERLGVETRVLSAILAGGTGNPYFTTDTTAALRALQIRAGVLAKGTKVDGVYSDDPETNPDAELFDELTFLDVLQKRLKIMDSTAVSLCMDNSLPINVFNMKNHGNVIKFLAGERLGTMVTANAVNT